MCRADKSSSSGDGEGSGGGGCSPTITYIFGFCTVAFMASTIALAVVYNQEKDKAAAAAQRAGDPGASAATTDTTTLPWPGSDDPIKAAIEGGYGMSIARPPPGENPCAGMKLTEGFENHQCKVGDVVQALEQAGANVTLGYSGGINATGRIPITEPYWKEGLCPVNVHWHLGAEHYSKGEFDENGSGPSSYRRQLSAAATKDDADTHAHADASAHAVEEAQGERDLAGNARLGFQCNLYSSTDPKYNEPYDWNHCIGMEVGQTYEVHWPHSHLGDCETVNQYQTPFYDGVFCNVGLLGPSGRTTWEAIGVHSQVFVIVNDETKYYPDLIKGMVVDPPNGLGVELTKYTGSTTGTSRNNEICSKYAPITWHVDRTCHEVSASSFDKMCADMKTQRDDMSDDLYAHGARELVADFIAANNQVFETGSGGRKMRGGALKSKKELGEMLDHAVNKAYIAENFQY
mmetsp:Transcript_34231/g.102469  ORF Transcript_34231/g.102469 Transcript_34231/m.102469 type:complete len:461 (-) Transcript_34231:219-1601(-)|eukprot:CAMPEP_0113550678 /NCGR_PEP_ID=MMETSP0015_2-20120614/14113_1 /TAXON_ID=2838 /ORGANISM="Odontella" /LENGTH=460 /DNA_ID=CAMNT_0000451507 /DNA_START=320 /DNA_END=1702 /DNA_ORIENTATION=- /assembly_acc=CAM_ASM_000160